eukprot:534012-Ditylum_brightwellii.AAC.1
MVKFAKLAFAGALLAAIPSASNFVAPKTPFLNEHIKTSGKVDSSTSLNIFAEDVPYGEESRKYRCTVYDFNAWKNTDLRTNSGETWETFPTLVFTAA